LGKRRKEGEGREREGVSYRRGKAAGGKFGFLNIQNKGDTPVLVWTTCKNPKLGLDRWNSG